MFRERNSCTVNKTVRAFQKLNQEWWKIKINKNVGSNLSISTISNLTPLLSSDFVSLKLEMCSLSLKMTLKCFSRRFCCGRFKNLITEFLVAYFWLDRLKEKKIKKNKKTFTLCLLWNCYHGASLTKAWCYNHIFFHVVTTNTKGGRKCVFFW